MKHLILIAALFISIGASAKETKECIRYCDAKVSKPCGKGCIDKSFTCHKEVTLSCVKPASDKK